MPWKNQTAFRLAGWLGVAASLTPPARAVDGPGVPNVGYSGERVGEILSIIDPGKAVSAVHLHRGYLFAPLGADHGGGRGAGAFAFYDVSDPASPGPVFDSRDHADRYHAASALDYVGNWAEIHHLPVSGDLMLISEHRGGSAGLSIFDVGPFFDNDPATMPRTVSRMSFSGVTSPTNYDGFSFAPAWQGRRYAYAPTGAQGLYIVDTTDLANPVQAAHISRSALGNVTLRAAWPIGNLLILAEGNVQGSFTARTFDIGNPLNPVALGTFSGPFGYHGFVYGGAFYGGGSPIARHDFTDPANVTRKDLYPNPGFNQPEYGFGKDGSLFIGHYPGATKWTIAGDTLIPAGRVNSGLVDDHAFLSPLGNLVVLSSDHNNDRKVMIGIHGTEPDVIAPRPDFVSPPTGAIRQNVLSRVGISFTDHVEPASANSTTMPVRKVATGEQVAGSYSVMGGIVNFAPDAPLDANATYDVYLAAGGVRDQAGNAVPGEVRVSRFSTGDTLLDYKTSIARTTARPLGETADFTVQVENENGLALEHSWDFGDGSPPTAFSAAETASHRYGEPGNFSVSVRTRIAGQTYAPFVSSVQVIHRAVAATPPVSQSTIVVDPDHPLVWNVNKDNGSVTAIHTGTHARVHEIATGGKPSSLGIGPDGTLWVVNKGSASISVIRRLDGAVVATHLLPPGSSPHGLVIGGGFAYVSLEALGEIAKISTADGSLAARLAVGPWPRGLALDPARQRLWVSRFISPDEGGKLVPVDLATFTAGPAVDLAPALDPDSLQNGRGIPNYLAAPVLSPDLSQAFIPSKKDNIFRGQRRDGLPLTFEHTVRSMAACLDLETGLEVPGKRLDFDNSDFATAAVFSPLGNQVFFATSGSATIWVADAYDPDNLYSFQADGLAPDGLALNADGSRLYIHNFMDRSVTVFRTTVACNGVCGTAPRLAKVATVTTEALPAAVLRGKQVFHDTSDPRLAQEGYMSCASCHLDGGHDGRVWDFSNFGEGLRRTIALNGRGTGHGPLHWSANFDEVQDFEGQIRNFARGAGLMSDAVFHHGTRAQPLGEKKAGLSADLDALAAYVQSLTTAGRSPHREPGGTLSAAALAGREIFRQENCASCHGGSAFTDSAALVRHDVGTLGAGSGERLGEALGGLDTPTLRGLWAGAPYLHDGSAPALRDVLVTRNPAGLHGHLSDRSETEIQQLVAYLESIDDLETAAPTTATGDGPALVVPVDRSDLVGDPVNVPLVASGGSAPFTWSAMALPPGVVLDAATGQLSGALAVTGTFSPTVSVRDGAGRSATVAFTWTISDPRARRHVRLVSLSSHNGGAFTSLADFTLLGLDGRPIDRGLWAVTASSQESTRNEGVAHAIDANPASIWHTSWSGTAFPHHLTIDLREPAVITGFTCLPRQDGNLNGRIKDFSFHWSDDGVNWGSPVALGSFPNNANRQIVDLDRDGDGFSDRIEDEADSDPDDPDSRPDPSFSGLAGWWRLNEAGGSVAMNVAGADGALVGSPARIPFGSGRAIRLNGSTQSVQLAVPNLTTGSATLGAWVKRDGSQNPWAGILFSRSGAVAGLHFGTSNELRYTWNDGNYGFDSGLVVPDGVWTYCAVVVEPARATFYMMPAGGEMQSVTLTASHTAATFTGSWHLGQDPLGGRNFKGDVDEARIYGRALTGDEIAVAATPDNRAPAFLSDPVTLADAPGGSAYRGTLAGQALDPDAGTSLAFAKAGGPAWLEIAADGTVSGIPTAANFGVNLFPIRVTDSFGATATGTLSVRVLDPERIDTDGDGFTNAIELEQGSDPLSATSRPDPSFAGLAGWWRLNEAEGDVAVNVMGDDGLLVGTPTRIPSVSGGGLGLNGSSQSVNLAMPNLTTGSATFSAWVKRDGNQNAWTGILFHRSGTVAGLHFGTANELRYTWKDGNYNFNSGLIVPDGEWTFCAVVVEPARATFYMKPAGAAMQSVTRTVGHTAATFAGNWHLGQDPLVGRLFKGGLDETRFYQRALGAGEIAFVANEPPSFLADPVTLADAVAGSPYRGNLAALARDPDPAAGLAFAKTGGPDWLQVAADGAVTGTPRASDFGVNQFTIRVTDPLGAAAAGTLTVRVVKPGTQDSDFDGFTDAIEVEVGTDPLAETSRPDPSFAGIKGWWHLNEAGGDVAMNVVGDDGVLVGAPARVSSVSGRAVRLDGSAQSVQLGPLELDTNTVTISAWVKREGNQPTWAGIVLDQSDRTGLEYGYSNELRYTWASGYYQFDSGLIVPEGVWTYCAVVVEPTQATFYMKPVGGAMQSVSRSATHHAHSVSGHWYLGRNEAMGRSLKGGVDEARFYRRALAAAEIAVAANLAPAFLSEPVTLADAAVGSAYRGTLAGQASDPDGAAGLAFAKTGGPAWLQVAADGTLSGSPSAADLGVNHFPIRVTDSSGAAATGTLQVRVLDPEFIDTDGDGFTDALELALGTDPGLASSRPSPVHAGLRAWWRFEEGSGSSASDATGFARQAGALVGSPAWTQGSSGSGLEFNGVDQAVRVAALHPASDALTLAAWVRRGGDQAEGAGIARFGPDGAASGMVFGPANQLRYRWNGGHSEFATGLTVPNGVWTFCALVIEPSKATLYMKPTGGGMQTWVHEVASGITPLTGDLYFGRDSSAAGRHFKGRLDEVRLHARSLAADEIAELAMLSAPPPDRSLPDTYAMWRTVHQLPAGGPGAEPDADPLGDGVSNLMKFALGLPADQRGYAGRFHAGTDASGGPSRNTLTYQRPEPAPAGARYAVEVTGDLHQWTGDGVEIVSETVANGLRTIVVRDSAAAEPGRPCRFIRLRVTQATTE